MGLRLILGRAGTGKTRTCLTEIRQALAESPLAGDALILLVPEQATFQMEQALVAAVETGGVIRAQVYSFRRLAWQVLQEVGGSARLPIGELGKRMVLRQLLETHRPELRVFHRAAGQPGFADTLAGILAELKLYNVATADLAQAASRLTAGPDPGLLGDKLHDLELLYQALSEFLAGRYTDPDDYLALLAARLPASALLAGAVVWVDGFAGFTPQELQVLGALLTVADQVNVTLCIDPEALAGPPEPGDPFYRTRDTYDRLCRLVREKQAAWEPAVVLPGPGPRFAAPVLRYLETAFFARPHPPFSGPLTGLGVYAGENRRSEVEGVAREIIRLCRDHGYRWREIAVFLRDQEPYDDLITTVFADFGIPFFMDRKRPVRHHPLVELIRSALEAVRRDWAYEPVFRYLKTDLVPVDREVVDRLENYVLAHGIRGSRWRDNQPWVYQRRSNLDRDGDEALSGEEVAELVMVNAARDEARVHLAAFHQAVKDSGDVRQLTAALYRLLLDLGVPGRIAAWSGEAEAAGEIETARAHRQVWTGVVDLLDQLVAALGPVPVDLVNYAAVVEAGLESLHLGLIPPELDQVLVGSLDRSRSPAVRAAFIPGVTEGEFPARLRDDGVFDDAERERLREVAGLELAPGARRRLLDEVYLVYLALTRAGERCYVSYPLADPEGRALTPSPVIARLRELFPGLTVGSWRQEPGAAAPAEEYVGPPRRCLSDLVPQLRAAVTGMPVEPVWWAVYSWFAGQDGWRDRLRTALAGLWHHNQEPDLPHPVSRLLYGQPLRAGITRLERFQACPFAHFAGYGLRLEPRPVFQLGAPDLGRFFHAALQRFGEALYREGRDWGELTPEQCRELTGRIVANLAPRLQSEILLSSARYRYLTGRLEQTVTRAVTVLGEHARRGRFRPLGLEVGFGPGEPLPGLRVPLSGERWLELTGRIDRIDVAEDQSRRYLRVIDYKSGPVTLKLPGIYHGLNLQLAAYLDIALLSAHLLDREWGVAAGTRAAFSPGGMLYFTVGDPLLAADGPLTPAAAARALLKADKMQGLVLAETGLIKLMDDRITGYSDLIPAGLKKDGDLYSNSAVFTGEQLEVLRRYLGALYRRVGEGILDGCVAIRPYRLGNRAACTWCLFKPVCQFDLLLPENTYRQLADEPPELVWPKFAQGPAGFGGSEGDHGW